MYIYVCIMKNSKTTKLLKLKTVGRITRFPQM